MNWNQWRLGRPKSKYAAWVCALCVGCFARGPLVQAGIISTTFVNPVSPPASVVPGVTVSGTPIVFQEVAGGVLAAALRVDHVVSGNLLPPAAPTVSGNVVNPVLLDGTIPAGTAYDSYFFHFDPGGPSSNFAFYPPFDPDNPNPPVEIQFSTKILGVQLFGTGTDSIHHFKPNTSTRYYGTLEDGDAISQVATIYPGVGEPTRGLESGDTIAIISGGFGIQLAGFASGGQIDQVRIIVAVPEPNSALLALMGLLGMSFLAIKKTGAIRRF